jgi:hypothetical protein
MIGEDTGFILDREYYLFPYKQVIVSDDIIKLTKM